MHLNICFQRFKLSDKEMTYLCELSKNECHRDEEKCVRTESW